jgi:4-hydroxybenzoate polyprenyltransferase
MTQPPHIPEAAPVADAPRGNWVDTLAPPGTRPYLRLSRADRPIGTWLLFIPCLWGVFLAAAATDLRPSDAWVVIGCAIGAFLMRGAGCTWNDITDRDIDAAVARTRSRPLPSGQLTVTQALGWMILQAAIAALILFTFNWNAVLLGIAALVPVLIYPFAKRFTWWPQAFLGIAFNWGALFGWAAHQGTVSLAPVFLYAAGIAWTLFYDTIYAHQDREDDALIGVRSTARLFGTDTARWLRWFIIATVSLGGMAVILALIDAPVMAMLCGLAGVWAMGWHMVWQLRRLDIDDPASCLRVFRSNRDAGLILALFLAIAAFV